MPRTSAARRQFHELQNNLAAVRLWLRMLEESSCAKCRKPQAEGFAAIQRNLSQMEGLLARRLLRSTPARRARRARKARA